jgi:membrane associated rhomboid family serine protease
MGFSRITPVVKYLVIVNSITSAGAPPAAVCSSVWPSTFLADYVWQPVATCSSTEVFHLFFNMLVLWMFGSTLESGRGSEGSLNIIYLQHRSRAAEPVVTPGSLIPTIPASGAIYGLCWLSVYNPEQLIYIWGIFSKDSILSSASGS